VTLVLDASLTLSWFFEDEQSEAGDDLLNMVAERGAFVPRWWRLEVANGLFVAMRRKRLDAAYRDKALAQLARLPITVDGETDAYAWSGTLHLSDRFQLTVYDAAYLELAHRRLVPLATLDRPLRAAAGELGVGVLGEDGDTSK